MAMIPPYHDWQITDIGDNVCLIQRIGYDEERVYLKYNPKLRNDFQRALLTVHDSTELNSEQKMWIFMWMGYFYAHMGRG